MRTLFRFQRALRDEPSIPDIARLKYLNAVYEHDPQVVTERLRRHDAIETMRAIFRCAEAGKIAVVESGMDCDCVQYDGLVRVIDATPGAFHRLWEQIAESADGRFSLRVMRPSEAESVMYRSRDRALEAYENGHPGRVTYGSLD